MNKRLYVVTYGCQMNERDSEEALGMLTAQGYAIVERAEEADVILLNTCSVRQHAEERAFGKMGEFSELKREKPQLILGIIGCMAKLHREAIFKRLPKVDLVAGPAELYDLPYLLAELQERRQQEYVARGSGLRALGNNGQPTAHSPQPSAKVVAVHRPFRPLDQRLAGDYRAPGIAAFVTIMEGCDKACAYCIVPKTRGQEISRPAQEIIQEINTLAEAGYQEITLLGQNVNAYGKRFPDGSGYKGPLGRLRLLEEDPQALLDFPQLLRLIDRQIRGTREHPSDRRANRELSEAAANGFSAAATCLIAPQTGAALVAASLPAERPSLGLRPRDPRRGIPSVSEGERALERVGAVGATRVRIRFTTSHPFDANERLFEALRDCDSVCEWLHLPVQSGSNRILRAMRRGYTAQAYVKKIERLRQAVPDISLSTDLIVGFPGETEEDVEATVRLMREVRYDNAYIFKYSPRPGTDAAVREDDVPQAVKEERNQRLLALQEAISLERHRALEGAVAEILVEQKGRFERQWFGKTRGNHGVIVESPEDLLGQMVQARITRGTAHTLFGELHASDPCNRRADRGGEVGHRR